MGAMKDQLLRTQELAENVLAEHQVESHGLTNVSPDYCRCGASVMPSGDAEIGQRRARAFARHQADMLADAWLSM